MLGDTLGEVSITLLINTYRIRLIHDFTEECLRGGATATLRQLGRAPGTYATSIGCLHHQLELHTSKQAPCLFLKLYLCRKVCVYIP